MAMLEVKDLHISFKVYSGEVKAIRGIDFTIEKGQTLALVGESGSGKSVSSKAIMRLLPTANTRIESGEIHFEGNDLLKLSEREMQGVRGKDIAMIFQNPMTALNPLIKIGDQIMEGMLLHLGISKKEAKKEALELLHLVGIPNPEITFRQFPHQLSGGMRQRVVIATALACKPKLLIADEPTTALDVTIQAQIIELLKDIQKKTGVAILFITHDLGVVATIADRIAVMYAGKIVEIGAVENVFYNPQHPYTWGLLSSIPDLENLDARLYSIPGTPPNLLNPPQGDAFAVRSEFAMDIDFEEEAPFIEVEKGVDHFAATWLLDERALKVTPPLLIQKRHERYAAMRGEQNGKG